MITKSNFQKSAFSTTAFRAAAIAVAVFTLAAAALMWFVSNQTNRVMTKQALAALNAEANILIARERTEGLSGLRREVELRSTIRGSGLYYLGSTNGSWIAGNLRAIPQQLRNSRTGGVFKYHRQQSQQSKSDPRLAVGVTLSYPKVTLVVARDIEDQRELSYQLRLVSLLGFGLLGIGGLVAGLIMSRLALSRVDGITNASRAIMAGDLSKRLPQTGTGDEFDRLTQSLNEMLARIEQLMHGLREVSDNIAHDLKTPLNRLRNRAEEALRDPGGATAQRQGLERTIEAADDLIKTFNALLLIARLEAGAIEDTLEDTDVFALVSDVAELYEPVAQDAGFSLQVGGGSGPETNTPVNRQLIGQSVANLIDNAIKYTKAGLKPDATTTKSQGKPDPVLDQGNRTDITVSVLPVPGGIEIAVGDRGPGIAKKDRERVLKRFVRLEKSRTAPGTGLGLSLVSAVARLHHATVRLEDNNPGLRVVLTLPQKSERSIQERS